MEADWPVTVCTRSGKKDDASDGDGAEQEMTSHQKSLAAVALRSVPKVLQVAILHTLPEVYAKDFQKRTHPATKASQIGTRRRRGLHD